MFISSFISEWWWMWKPNTAGQNGGGGGVAQMNFVVYVDKTGLQNIKRSKVLSWVDCDDCSQWFHNVCAGLPTETSTYVCKKCNIK